MQHANFEGDPLGSMSTDRLPVITPRAHAPSVNNNNYG